MRRRFTASWLLSGFSLLAGVAPIAKGADPLYESARVKLDSLWYATAPPGSEILFTPREIEAWTVAKAKDQVGEGLRKPRVTLETGSGSGAALVDFLRMRQARGKSTNAVMARMLEGERPLKVYVRVTSGGGRCTVYLTRVELSGTVTSGTVLDYVIKTFLLPIYPDVTLDEPFDLPLNMERIELLPQGVRVTMKK
jgi:hypothetical protein